MRAAGKVQPEAENLAVEGSALSSELITPSVPEKRLRQPRNLNAIPPELFLQATLSARSFQRSALGYLDHPDWQERVRTDAKNLVKVLAAMGFVAEVSRVMGTNNAR
ncbi:hypothetical protein [Novosphingobium sp. AP12]|uniref:hypothetical protein n=1 Tax=Novosphingobium sp. AP12 TaxID=1144305 RepID=UPI000271F6A4|nr:hypothetical protein [Novosphingobium sp. AP12]EJL22946.1 hypothetical protein PMI02_04368 [Novosphingobium sp. AP12]